jgi:hypothetical protein
MAAAVKLTRTDQTAAELREQAAKTGMQSKAGGYWRLP